MDLEYKMKDSSALKSSSGKPQVVRVEFDPPLLGYEEVKPRLLGMKVDADSALGTVRLNPLFHSLRFRRALKALTIPHPFSQIVDIQVKAPQITHFELPFQIWTTASLLLLLIYTSSVPSPPDSNPNHADFWWLARAICPGFVPSWMIPLSWAIVAIAHTGEGVYAATLTYKHHMPWHIAVSSLFSQPL
jgi:hypothetical protein